MLSIQNLTSAAGDKEILHNISYEFAPSTTYAILGPNGSGKSTLGNTLMGHPHYTTSEESIALLDDENLLALSPDERAQKGLFLSFQNPLPLTGVTVMDLLRMTLVAHKKLDALTLHKKVREYAEELNIKEELLKRSLHDGFSGGEKKKIEALQAVLLAPRVAIFDEIDTGVDVDALRQITVFLKAHLPQGATLIYITHSHKLLSILEPSQVLVIKNGSLVKTGDHTLAEIIEQEGFENI